MRYIISGSPAVHRMFVIILVSLTMATASSPSDGAMQAEVGASHIDVREARPQRLVREEVAQDVRPHVQSGALAEEAEDDEIEGTPKVASASSDALDPADINLPPRTKKEKEERKEEKENKKKSKKSGGAHVPESLKTARVDRWGDGKKPPKAMSPHAVVLSGSAGTNCPWLGSKGTGDDNAMKCWDKTTCNPTTDAKGLGCCVSHGGAIQCPDSMPMMCETKAPECGGDFCCQVDCSDKGGERECKAGPAGFQGADGNYGPQGPMGPVGDEGAHGDSGPRGKMGMAGETGDPGISAADGLPANLANKNLFMMILAMNGILAIGLYVFLKIMSGTKQKANIEDEDY